MEINEDFKDILERANNGDDEAQYEVAYTYDFGLYENEEEIVSPDADLAFEWYGKAYTNGNLYAAIRLADLLSEGVGCEKNIDLATEVYLQCIENGSSMAANNLGMVYRDMGNYEKAFEYYCLSQKLLSEEYKATVYALNVGLCYYYGIGVAQNTIEAINVFKNIAESNLGANTEYEKNEASYLLGIIYLNGNGVNKDIETARKYLLLANKDDDHRSAQELLFTIGK